MDINKLVMSMTNVEDLRRKLATIIEMGAPFDRAQAALATVVNPTDFQRYAAKGHFIYVPPKGRDYAQPLWDGRPLNGRTCLVHIDQGLGDTLQYYRFLPPGKVILETPDPLVRLFTAQPNAPVVIPEDDRLPPFDVHCPMEALPWLTGATEPRAAPYLQAPRGVSPMARPRGLWVGIVWAGNPLHENDRNRSMPLRTMLDMLPAGVEVISLQKPLRPTDRLPLYIADLGASLSDFYLTAYAISQLDLVISVDTSTAHLAGALGKPVWILLPYEPDPRWTHKWYGSARVFRQERPGDWSGVARGVREALS